MKIPRFRVGLGHDTHRLGAGRRLVLGGVEIPHETGLVGHSDADVLLHAITDALLGSCGLGDIGELRIKGAAEYTLAGKARIDADDPVSALGEIFQHEIGRPHLIG